MRSFKLMKGEISFEPDRIRISDNLKKERIISLFSSSLWTMYGAISVFRYLKTGDQFLLWTGIFIGVAHLILLIVNLLRSNANEILYSEITSIKITRRSKNKFLDLRLKNNRLRRVNGVENLKDIEEYLKANLESRIKFSF